MNLSTIREAADYLNSHPHLIHLLIFLLGLFVAWISGAFNYLMQELLVPPFSTKHGVKGAQFENVLVVLKRGWKPFQESL